LAPANEVVTRLEDAPLGDASRIHPVPLILTTAERDWLRGATHQRARALQCFFADIAGGTAEFLDRPDGMPSALADRVLASHGHRRDDLRRCWSRRTRADVCFTYAPDLIRAADRPWRVLEDNIGCIGGLADSYYCQRAYLEAVKLDPRAYGEEVPDLCRGVQAFLAEADVSAVGIELGCDGQVDGKVIRESARRGALLGRIGLPVGQRGGDATASHIVNFTPAHQDRHEAFGRGDLTMLNAPFVEVLGDKRLLPYIEAMVAFYLGEDAALRSLPARAIEGPGDVAGMDSGVVKHGSGAQGTAVYFLDDPIERAQAVRALSAAEPWSFVLQDAAAPAAASAPLANLRLELRPFAFVAGEHIWASRIPSARVPRSDRRRANLSHGAHYAAVLTENSLSPRGS